MRKFVETAQQLIPKLYEQTETLPDMDKSFGKGEKIILDFGHNRPAYFQFDCEPEGIQDAPVFLKIRFCELERETEENCEDYNGWISRGWIQEEWIHIDELPCRKTLERRYTFRYAVIYILDTSRKYRVRFRGIRRKTVSAVREQDCIPFRTEDPLLQRIDEVSVRTLGNCMQTVFEDGPKRDRRLWLGDLRLQALVNYHTFKDYSLVRRCLYLFAGLADRQGRIPACVFERPVPHGDDTFLLDYSLFYLFALLEYFQYSKDRRTLDELAPSALRQIDLGMKFVDAEGCVFEEGREKDGKEYHCFIDWGGSLNKQCAMQGIFICSLKKAETLCRILQREEQAAEYRRKAEWMTEAAARFWDEKEQVFVSGQERQISSASQVWMILAGAVSGNAAAELLARTEKSTIKMVTPYMHHFYIMALILSGRKDRALDHIRDYWGGMIREGADTFWELYNPENPEESPYGGVCVNSFCHAWSCTPAYVLRSQL